jgi:ferredoxin
MTSYAEPAAGAKKLGLVIDLDTCVGCHACAVNCKEWNSGGHSAPMTDFDPYGANASGVWFNRRHRRDLLASALHALHGLQADRDYLVVDRAVKLLDPVTGRPAEGRVWSRGLQAAVEMKEGCPLSPPTRVAARLGLQRFFSRSATLSAR